MFGLSDNTIKEIVGVFKRHPEIEKVLVFGSRAKGCYREGSDIDLALFGDQISRNILLDVSCDIDDLELLYNIDLVNYQDVKDKPIGSHIMRVGKVFYVRR